MIGRSLGLAVVAPVEDGDVAPGRPPVAGPAGRVGLVHRAEDGGVAGLLAHVHVDQPRPDREVRDQDPQELAAVAPDPRRDRDLVPGVFHRAERRGRRRRRPAAEGSAPRRRPGSSRGPGSSCRRRCSRACVSARRTPSGSRTKTLTNGFPPAIPNRFSPSIAVLEERLDRASPLPGLGRGRERGEGRTEPRVVRQDPRRAADQAQLPIDLAGQPPGLPRVLRPQFGHRDGEAGQPEREGRDAHQDEPERVPTHPEAELPRGRRLAAGQGRPAVEPPAEVVRQRVGRPVAPVGVAVEALQADRVQLAIDLRVELAGARQIALDDEGQGLPGVPAPERLAGR